MADRILRLGLLAFALGGCDPLSAAVDRSAITVKLPPARPAAPAPGFAFADPKAEAAPR